MFAACGDGGSSKVKADFANTTWKANYDMSVYDNVFSDLNADFTSIDFDATGKTNDEVLKYLFENEYIDLSTLGVDETTKPTTYKEFKELISSKLSTFDNVTIGSKEDKTLKYGENTYYLKQLSDDDYFVEFDIFETVEDLEEDNVGIGQFTLLPGQDSYTKDGYFKTSPKVSIKLNDSDITLGDVEFEINLQHIQDVSTLKLTFQVYWTLVA
jgi:hypothetical protein